MLVEQEHTEGNCPDVGGAVATALPGSRSAKQSEGCLLKRSEWLARIL